MTVTGAGAIEGLPLSNARATFSTDGRFSETASLGFDAAGVSVQGALDATASLPDSSITGQITGSFSVFGQALGTRTIPFSDDGFGVCQDSGVGPLRVSAGFVYKWSGAVDVSLVDCDSDLSQSSSAAHAAANGVQVAPGSDVEELVVHGVSGAPSVVLTSPSGRTVLPSTSGGRAAAVAVAFGAGRLTAVAIRHPEAGVWHLTPAPGSSAIASVTAARGYPAPELRARVSGTGRQRTLIYSVSRHPGLVVNFAEFRRGRLLAVIAAADHARGIIRFTPADGPSGSRQIVALLAGGGTVPRTVSLAITRPAHRSRAARMCA
jgi:hypothetical protein